MTPFCIFSNPARLGSGLTSPGDFVTAWSTQGLTRSSPRCSALSWMKQTINALGVAALIAVTLIQCAKKQPTLQPPPPSEVLKPSAAPAPPPIVLPPVRVKSLAGPQSLYPPNPKTTPGAIDPRVSQATIKKTICVPGYTDTVALSTAYADPIKSKMLADRHLPGTVQNYELDYLIPLDLGGSPTSPRNLWMEPYGDANHLLLATDKWPDDGSVLPGAHQKDIVETMLSQEVCEGKITLKDAQEKIRTDWYALYKARAGRTAANAAKRYGVHSGPGQTVYVTPRFAMHASERVCDQLHDPSLQRAVALTPLVFFGGVGYRLTVCCVS